MKKASEEYKGRKTKKKEDWIGVIHSINRITQKVDIKIPVECKNDKQDRRGYPQVYINDMVWYMKHTGKKGQQRTKYKRQILNKRGS